MTNPNTKYPTIFELSVPGRKGVQYPKPDVPKAELPKNLLRDELPLPELSELDVIRHFTNLSQLNHSVDNGFYPLGSCTMKYNPKINEETARLAGFSQIHPLQPTQTVQGALGLMYETQQWLAEISGFDAVTLQPGAGAHGELTGVLIIRAYHQAQGDDKRVKILVPDSAHGTNPASSAMSGLKMVEIPSDERGNVNLELCQLVHAAGGLVYGDGANLNALLGITRPGDSGIDVMHFNLHKTFATPHGGGGPGSGPVGVTAQLAEFLPDPVVAITEEETEENPPVYDLITPKQSIGRVKSFHGHFGVIVKAFTYMLSLGKNGLREAAEYAVLNANYIQSLVKDAYNIPYERLCMHEFVAIGEWEDAPGIRALDISKRLMDFGIHPPTNYFPLIVHEALMIEPTETESKATLDNFAKVLITIAEEAHTDPEKLKQAPHTTPFGRLDEVKAAKDLKLRTQLPEGYGR
ncbi:MAG: glycine dehydrogenase (aminomethyl-transferring) [Anaerolineaceae bacterium 4572_5.1]|nr:MAG: glycine dehydrogenase (aminomethyl-transferring) [Anaerolineaceae bacterium 4572_5.1]